MMLKRKGDGEGESKRVRAAPESRSNTLKGIPAFRLAQMVQKEKSLCSNSICHWRGVAARDSFTPV